MKAGKRNTDNLGNMLAVCCCQESHIDTDDAINRQLKSALRKSLKLGVKLSIKKTNKIKPQLASLALRLEENKPKYGTVVLKCFVLYTKCVYSVY